MAAPFVAGAAALIWGKWPTLNRTQVLTTLTSTGDTGILPDEAYNEFPGNVRHLNVYKAFESRMTMPTAGGALLGLVVDANTGLPLGGATVTAKAGTITRTATTRADGTFTITNLPAGPEYAVTASRTGYVTTPDERTWTVSEGCYNLLPFFSLPQNQAPEVWTAVVEWRGWCGLWELDAYLWLPGTLPDRQKYMVGWFDRGNLNAHPFARFLRDEPGGMPFRPWGPLFTEAVTFRTRYTGTYTFAVHDFSGWGNWCCGDAVVRLYRGTALVGTYLVCNATGSGQWWTVFQVSGTTVIPVNSLGTAFPAGYGWEFFGSAAQRKTPYSGPQIPDRTFQYNPR